MNTGANTLLAYLVYSRSSMVAPFCFPNISCLRMFESFDEAFGFTVNRPHFHTVFNQFVIRCLKIYLDQCLTLQRVSDTGG
jgi:hypothetical protein